MEFPLNFLSDFGSSKFKEEAEWEPCEVSVGSHMSARQAKVFFTLKDGWSHSLNSTEITLIDNRC